jgi:hypothetical protein
LVVCGTVALVLGIVGAFVPVWPTTPFLLLAAACYARSSERLYGWLLDHRVFGSDIRDYRERRGMQRRAKVVALALLWLVIGLSILAVDPIWLRLLLAAIATAVTAHILRLRTLRSDIHQPKGG